MIKDVYFDMDGVITDFDSALEENMGRMYNTKINGFKERTLVTYRFKEYMNIAVSKNLFLYLKENPYLEDFKTAFLYPEFKNKPNLHILSATDNWGVNNKIIIDNKETWLKNHRIYNFFKSVIFVDKGIDKAKYASATSLLIDDNIENCTAFSREGGNSLLYNIDYHHSCLNKIIEVIKY